MIAVRWATTQSCGVPESRPDVVAIVGARPNGTYRSPLQIYRDLPIAGDGTWDPRRPARSEASAYRIGVGGRTCTLPSLKFPCYGGLMHTARPRTRNSALSMHSVGNHGGRQTLASADRRTSPTARAGRSSPLQCGDFVVWLSSGEERLLRRRGEQHHLPLHGARDGDSRRHSRRLPRAGHG